MKGIYRLDFECEFFRKLDFYNAGALVCAHGLYLKHPCIAHKSALAVHGRNRVTGLRQRKVLIRQGYPRDGDANYGGEWGHDSLSFMNGWSTATSRFTTIRAMGSYEGNICYCIEPGVPQQTGNTFTKKGEDFWDEYPSSYNSTISPDDMMRVFGYDDTTCSRYILGAYRPISYLGFAIGTVYQYGLLRLMVSVVFSDIENVPEYSFDFRALTITLIIFVFTYELVMYLYSRSIKRLSVKSIMLE